jgi:hypothetical protein
MGYKDNQKQIEYMREWRKRQPKKRISGGGVPNYIATKRDVVTCQNCINRIIAIKEPERPPQPEIPLPSSDSDDSSVEPDDDSSVEPDDSSVEPDDDSSHRVVASADSSVEQKINNEEYEIAKIPKRYLQTPAGCIIKLITVIRNKIDLWTFMKMKKLALKSINENTNPHAHNCYLLCLLHECTGN